MDPARAFAQALVAACVCATLAGRGAAEERTQHFDTDPKWEGLNNRATDADKRTVVQRFGYSPTHHAGGKSPGEMGGLVHPAAEPAYYAKKIPAATFDDQLTASGTLACTGQTASHFLIGFFNSGTLNEWRTPNSLALRIRGRGDHFFAYVEYATSRWRAGGDSPGGFATIVDPATGKRRPRGFAAGGKVHRWSLSYHPPANAGNGSIVATIDDETAVCHLSPGHKLDGATFDRFGLLNAMKHWDSPGEIWLDDVTVNGQLEDFSADPHWDARGNQRTYVTANVRPHFDFGYSPTHFAGGTKAGELGGLVFRGDIRSPKRMAYYADRLEKLTLDRPLRASGTVTLRRGVTDSGTLIGFFNSRESVRTNDSQATGIPDSFLGAAIEGPSRVGFWLYPVSRAAGGDARTGKGDDRTTILPDGSVHRWSLEYSPQEAGGRVSVTLDKQTTTLELATDPSTRRTEFDSFGILSTWIDGNGQQIYFDDLSYTCRQDE